MKITEKNWNTARFIEGELMAFISFGATPLNNDSKEMEFIYSVIVSNKDYEEVSEQNFNNLDTALTAINERFSHWELSNLNNKNEGGCSSCAAH